MPVLEPKRDYIKNTELQTGQVIKFVSEGEWIENKKFTYEDGTPQRQFIIQIETILNNQEVKKIMSLNATNRDIMIEAYGRDTKKWIGKEAEIEKLKQNIAGTFKEIAYLKVNKPTSPEKPKVEVEDVDWAE